MEKLTDAEHKLMNLIWEKGSLSSGELVREAESRMGWKKSTTYTLLKKLEEKEMAVNKDSRVTPLITHEQYYQFRRKYALDTYFDGSLPAFLTAFFQEKKLTSQEIQELEQIIQDYKNH